MLSVTTVQGVPDSGVVRERTDPGLAAVSGARMSAAIIRAARDDLILTTAVLTVLYTVLTFTILLRRELRVVAPMALLNLGKSTFRVWLPRGMGDG